MALSTNSRAFSWNSQFSRLNAKGKRGRGAGRGICWIIGAGEGVRGGEGVPSDEGVLRVDGVPGGVGVPGDEGVVVKDGVPSDDGVLKVDGVCSGVGVLKPDDVRAVDGVLKVDGVRGGVGDNWTGCEVPEPVAENTFIGDIGNMP